MTPVFRRMTASMATNIRKFDILVRGKPTELLTVGSSPEDKPKKIVLIIPGNPGLAGYYTSFMETIHGGLQGSHAVWALSHAAHCRTSRLSILGDEVYELKEQLKHKVDFIHDFVPQGARLVLVGHSIGCQILLNLMDSMKGSSDYTIEKAYLLFPTIERMKTTPSGKRLWPILCYFRWLAVFLAVLLSLLPRGVVRFLIHCHMGRNVPEHVVNSTVELLSPNIIRNVMWMAYTELSEVNEPNINAIEGNLKKIVLYYGAKDEWCPVSYYNELAGRVRGVAAEVCGEGHEHAFVIKSSVPMAQKVVHWISTQI